MEALRATLAGIEARANAPFFIDGTWRESAQPATLDVIAPHSEELLMRHAEATHGEVDRAVAAARRAFDHGPWPRMAPADRGAALKRVAALLAERLPELADAWTGQVGAVIGFTRNASRQVPGLFDFYGDLAASYPFVDRRTRSSGGRVQVISEPAGVCAAITPWNAPLVLLCYKVAAGLAAGCTFVVKPSPETPIDAHILAECIAGAGLPDGVFNMIQGGREIGDYLVRHPGIDKVSFTGSTVAGKAIASACAARLTRFSLELGGKSAAIILDDADLSKVLPTLVPYSMPITGQVCFSLTRVLVSTARYNEVLDGYVSAVRKVNVGNPFEDGVQMGPLSLARQRDRVETYVARGIAEGARLVTGGGRPAAQNRGWYFEPTVFADVTQDMTIAREEIFGPVVSLIRYDDEAELIAQANATDYGLHGAIYSADEDRALAIAREVDAGSLAINGMAVDIEMPFGGFKQSGIGREGGLEGLQNYLELKTVYLPG